jgi:hypothetical protein
MIRPFASAILRAAILRASPEGQQWGRAMLREMDFVEGDWAALRWAIGSVLSLLRGFRPPARDLARATRALQSFRRKIRIRNRVGLSAVLFLIAFLGYWALVDSSLETRLGDCLTVAGSLLMGIQLYTRRVRKIAVETESSSWISRFRAELQRQRDFHQGVLFWSRAAAITPGPILSCIGMAAANPETARLSYGIAASFVFLLLLAVPLNRTEANKYQRQMDELDILGKELL